MQFTDYSKDAWGNSNNPTWNEVLEEKVAAVRGYTEANDRMVEGVPFEQSFRAKPIPKLLLLRWQDRTNDAGTNTSNAFHQYNRFGWNLPEAIWNGFDTMTYFLCTMNDTFYLPSTNSGLLGIQVNVNKAMLGSGIITSADNKSGAKMVSPTFLVPNVGNSVQPVSTNFAQGCPYPINSPWSTNIRGQPLTNIELTLTDENLAPLPFNTGSPTNPYFFNLCLLLQ